MRDFRKLVAWQKADDLVVHVYQVTRSFPSEERYGLTSQMRRAAVSVAANIAEGSGKQTLKEFQHFLHNAADRLRKSNTTFTWLHAWAIVMAHRPERWKPVAARWVARFKG